MDSLFLFCAIAGGGILVMQFVLALFGLGGDHSFDHGGIDPAAAGHDLAHGSDPHDAQHGRASAGLNLFSVRAIATGLAFSGLTGLAALRIDWPVESIILRNSVAVGSALLMGVLGMVLVAVVMRALLGLESDGSIHLTNAIGQPATVYVPIPGDDSGAGKVLLALQGRTMEYDAMTSGAALGTGESVTVVDVRDGDILDVRRAEDLLEPL